jgi:hypothetical protein
MVIFSLVGQEFQWREVQTQITISPSATGALTGGCPTIALSLLSSIVQKNK